MLLLLLKYSSRSAWIFHSNRNTLLINTWKIKCIFVIFQKCKLKYVTFIHWTFEDKVLIHIKLQYEFTSIWWSRKQHKCHHRYVDRCHHHRYHIHTIHFYIWSPYPGHVCVRCLYTLHMELLVLGCYSNICNGL